MKCPLQKSTQYNGPLPCIDEDCGFYDHDESKCSMVSLADSFNRIVPVVNTLMEEMKREKTARENPPPPVQYCEGCDYFVIKVDENNAPYCLKYKADTSHNPTGAATRLNICLTEQGFR